MNRIIALYEPLKISTDQEISYDDIRDILEQIEARLNSLWEKLARSELYDQTGEIIKWGTVPKLNFVNRTLQDPDPISEILEYSSNQNLVGVLFIKEIDYKTSSKNWVRKIKVEFIAEIILNSEIKEQWSTSSNHFSVKTIVNEEGLGRIIKDFYLELLFRKYFEHNRYFGPVIKSIELSTLPQAKLSFIQRLGNPYHVQSDISFYPFSKIIRNISGNNNLSKIRDLWLMFLVSIAVKNNVYLFPPKNMVPCFKSPNDAFKLLPAKYNNSIPIIKHNTTHSEQLLVMLIKGLIGLDAKRKRHIQNLFGSEKPKIRSVVFLPYSQHKSLEEIGKNLIIIPFKLK